MPPTLRRAQPGSVDLGDEWFNNTNAFKYSALQPPSFVEWQKLLEAGAPGSGDGDCDQKWIDDLTSVCTGVLAHGADQHPARDWNAELQVFVEQRYEGDDLGERIVELCDSFESGAIAAAKTAIQSTRAVLSGKQAEGSAVCVRKPSAAKNGFPTASWVCSGLFVHLSSEPRMPSRLTRNHAYAAAAGWRFRVPGAPGIAASPLLVCNVFAEGYRAVVTAPAPLRERAWPGGTCPRAAAAAASLAELLGASELADGCELWYGGDARVYLVAATRLLPASASAGGVGRCLRAELVPSEKGRAGVLAPTDVRRHEDAAFERFQAEVKAGKVPELKPSHAPATALSSALKQRGLSVGAYLGPLSAWTDGPAHIPTLAAVEMAARTVRHVVAAQVAAGKDGGAGFREVASRGLHCAVMDKSLCDNVLVPCVLKKFGLQQQAAADLAERLSGKGSRQLLLYRCCSLLGIFSTVQQQVGDVRSFAPASSAAAVAYDIFPAITGADATLLQKRAMAAEKAQQNPDTVAEMWLRAAVLWEEGGQDCDPEEDTEHRASVAFAKAAEYAALVSKSQRRASAVSQRMSQTERASCARWRAALVLERAGAFQIEREQGDGEEEEEEDGGACGGAGRIDMAVRMRRLACGDDATGKVVRELRNAEALDGNAEPDEELAEKLVAALATFDEQIEGKGLHILLTVVPILIPLLRQLTKAEHAVGTLDAAERHGVRLAAAATDAFGQQSAGRVEAATLLARVLQSAKQFDKAGALYSECVTTQTALSGEIDLLTATAINNLACSQYEHALQSMKDRPKGWKGPLYRPHLGGEGKRLLEAARENFEKVLAMPADVLAPRTGADASVEADATNNLAAACYSLGRLSRAEELYEKIAEEARRGDVEEEAEAADANLRRVRNRRRMLSALHVQAVWRGVLARRRRRLLQALQNAVVQELMDRVQIEEESSRGLLSRAAFVLFTASCIADEEAHRAGLRELDREFRAGLDESLARAWAEDEERRRRQAAERMEVETEEEALRGGGRQEEEDAWAAIMEQMAADRMRMEADMIAAQLRQEQLDEEERRRQAEREWAEGLGRMYTAFGELQEEQARAEQDRQEAEAWAELQWQLELADVAQREAPARAGIEAVEDEWRRGLELMQEELQEAEARERRAAEEDAVRAAAQAAFLGEMEAVLRAEMAAEEDRLRGAFLAAQLEAAEADARRQEAAEREAALAARLLVAAESEEAARRKGGQREEDEAWDAIRKAFASALAEAEQLRLALEEEEERERRLRGEEDAEEMAAWAELLKAAEEGMRAAQEAEAAREEEERRRRAEAAAEEEAAWQEMLKAAEESIRRAQEAEAAREEEERRCREEAAAEEMAAWAEMMRQMEESERAAREAAARRELEQGLADVEGAELSRRGGIQAEEDDLRSKFAVAYATGWATAEEQRQNRVQKEEREMMQQQESLQREYEAAIAQEVLVAAQRTAAFATEELLRNLILAEKVAVYGALYAAHVEALEHLRLKEALEEEERRRRAEERAEEEAAQTALQLMAAEIEELKRRRELEEADTEMMHVLAQMEQNARWEAKGREQRRLQQLKALRRSTSTPHSTSSRVLPLLPSAAGSALRAGARLRFLRGPFAGRTGVLGEYQDDHPRDVWLVTLDGAGETVLAASRGLVGDAALEYGAPRVLHPRRRSASPTLSGRSRRLPPLGSPAASERRPLTAVDPQPWAAAVSPAWR